MLECKGMSMSMRNVILASGERIPAKPGDYAVWGRLDGRWGCRGVFPDLDSAKRLAQGYRPEDVKIIKL
jgi:hypothetical protein